MRKLLLSLVVLACCLFAGKRSRSPTQCRLSRPPRSARQEGRRRRRAVCAARGWGRSLRFSTGRQLLLSLGYDRAGRGAADRSAVEAKEDAKGNVRRAPTRKFFFCLRTICGMEKFTGPKLGAENPDAPKITGFDRVEEMGKLPDEVSKVLGGGRAVIYTDVASAGRDVGQRRAACILEADERLPVFSGRQAHALLAAHEQGRGRSGSAPQGGRRLGRRALCGDESGEAECARI